MAFPFSRHRGPARLVPGIAAPDTGIYRVYHYAHRLPHGVVVVKGDVLPKCKRCGDKVEYVLVMQADLASADSDLGGEGASSAAS